MSARTGGQLPPQAEQLFLMAVSEEGLDVSPGAPGDTSPDSPTRQAVELLLSYGLVRMDEERRRLMPVDPDAVALHLERQAAEEAARSLTWATGLRGEWSTLASAFRAGPSWNDPAALTRRVSGLGVIGEQLQMALSRVSVRVWTIQPGGPRPGPELRASMANELALSHKNIDRRILYQDPARYHRDTQAFVRQVQEVNAQVRTLPFLPQRTFIIDDLVVYPDRGDLHMAVFNREPTVVDLMTDQFEDLWKRAIDFTDRPLTAKAPDDEDLGDDTQQGSVWRTLTPEQRRIARLVVINDLTLDQAASQCGWALRTVNRHLQAIRDAYGAAGQATLGWRMRADLPDDEWLTRDE